MTELSSATTAVYEAFGRAPLRYEYVSHDMMHGALPAALRAAADQVVPPALEEEFNDRNQALPLKKMVEIRRKLNAIADELQSHQLP